MTANSLRVPGADGIELHVLEWSTAGVPLLFVHGFGNEAHIWDDIVPVVAPHYRTLAIDLRGHGDSDWDPGGRYSYESHLADLECATRALGVERLVLIGHSLGGRIATLFASRHPERLAGFGIVDAGPEIDPRGSLRIRQENERGAGRTFTSREQFRVVAARNYPAASAQAIDRMVVHGLRECAEGGFAPKLDPRAAVTRGKGSTAATPGWDALARISCPALVLRGAASDVLSAEVAERMAEVLPEGQWVEIPRAGHSVMVDNPAAVSRAIAAFALSDG